MKNTPYRGKARAQNDARHEWFQVELQGCWGLALPEFLSMKALATSKHNRTKTAVAHSVINIFLPGGMAQQESFAPKTTLPSDWRGSFGSNETAVKGVRLGEHLPRLALITDELTIIRSGAHSKADHERGTHSTAGNSALLPSQNLPASPQEVHP